MNYEDLKTDAEARYRRFQAEEKEDLQKLLVILALSLAIGVVAVRFFSLNF